MNPTNHQSPATNHALYLAPMAGVTNTIFRQICLDHGADVLTSEFVSAEGILHRNTRTQDYLDFDERERPVGVQLFGASPDALAEASRHVIDWVRPDFIDLNFGCPVNKVVSKQGGSALLKDCPLLERVARAVVRAAAPLPVTAKIRIGWNADTVNATTTSRVLEQAGITRLAVHGRTKEQAYSGEADWNVIAEVADTISIPVIGNGDIATGGDALKRTRETRVAGLMIGRAAMANPWIFEEIKAALAGKNYTPPADEERWKLMLDHCRREAARRGDERRAMHSLRARLMAYSRALPRAKALRTAFAKLESVAQLEDLAATQVEQASSLSCEASSLAPRLSAQC